MSEMNPRRPGVRELVVHGGFTFAVQFNVNPDTGRFSECFYSDDGAIKHGADIHALIVDACISISKRIEHGETFKEIALSLGEDRAPGADHGPPSSILGAIAAAGAALDD